MKRWKKRRNFIHTVKKVEKVYQAHHDANHVALFRTDGKSYVTFECIGCPW